MSSLLQRKIRKFVIVILTIMNEKEAYVSFALNIYTCRRIENKLDDTWQLCQLMIDSLLFVLPPLKTYFKALARGVWSASFDFFRHKSIRDLILWVSFSWIKCLRYNRPYALVMVGFFILVVFFRFMCFGHVRLMFLS